MAVFGMVRRGWGARARAWLRARLRIARGRVRAVGVAGVAAVLLGGTLPVLLERAPAVAADPCAAPVTNPVACENTKPGTPSSEWETFGSGDGVIEGFTTEFSVNVGQTVHFKIRTSGAYTMDIYRVGYYQGNGARRVASVIPVQRTQPNCMVQADSGLIDCGNWQQSASWAVPSTAVSGVYLARIERGTGEHENNHVVFVVRNDASHSDMLFQTSDTSWQAYNNWGGNSLYFGTAPAGRAYKVSYNRPFRTRYDVPGGRDFLFANEYPMIRFLERNGYDLSYFSGIDADRAGALIRNHRAFLSVGHDEYWSGAQRANVESARDAGVNLAFFSGNEVFWKTRWENSVDGTNTPYRSLVTYKETHANAKIDPEPVSTGTWRDPRFGPDGGKPENGLTGTIWTVNCCSYAMKVPAADGRMRLWRNTSIANLAPGTVATLPDETLGYEWDEDLDNGARPPGLFPMSTTTENVEQYAQGYGSTIAPGTATHHLTMYRAASGARVFGAGTVQWSWGLDNDHDGSSVPADVRMQQATVNLFADMGVAPSSLMAGLVPATASTDTAAPQSNLSSPAPNAQLASGSTVTLTGTAADFGGGRVGGVEVSTDGGTTWHPATGRESWSYTWRVGGTGAVPIRTRAVDDSGNLESPGVGITVNVSCPCSIFGQTVPPGAPSGDPTPIEAGVKFRSATDGWVTGIRFYKDPGNTGTHLGHLWSSTGTLLASATFTSETATGWQSAQFATPVHVSAEATYVASYFAPAGNYRGTNNHFFAKGENNPPLTALRNGVDGDNGVYRAGSSGFPTNSFNASNYWVDLTFDTQGPPDPDPPAVTASNPLNGSTSVSTGARPAVVFGEAIAPATLSFAVSDQAGTGVAGATSYDPTSRIATFTPSAPLALGTRYTATVSGARDFASPPNTMNPYAFSFTTMRSPPVPGACPCSIWNDSTQPATVTVDDRKELELGVRFRAEADGFVEGVRFYKGPSNTGTHTGTLWSASGPQQGTELASATFNFESTTGWQEVRFANPVQVTEGTVYVASYHTTTGWYSATVGGLNAPVTSGPLTAPGHASGEPNGVYRYGPRAFPEQGNGTNYFVDVVYTQPPDDTPPVVASASPSEDATSVPVGTRVAVVFDEKVSSAGTFTLTGPGGAGVAGSTAYDAARRTLTFTPSAPLTAGSGYTGTVSGATDTRGNTMATPHTWSFTTSGPEVCPCTLFPSDATPATASTNDHSGVELGVKFTADSGGSITGIRFYKGANNTGTHVGHLWKADGTLLKTATFSGESATGWQTVTFPTPVPVDAGTTYVASYLAPNGGYAVSGGFFTGAGYDNVPLHAPSDGAAGGNGVFRYGGGGFPSSTYGATNYWVDPVFTPGAGSDTVAPSVESTNPAAGQTSVPPGTDPSVVFDEPVRESTVRFDLTGPGGAAVAGTVSYDAATTTARFQPAGALAHNTTYTATVSGAKDTAGNPMAGTRTWSFTTATAPGSGCPCSVWPDTALPSVASAADDGAVEVGMKFRADSGGLVTGVRFYKGPGNTGSHVGHLWSSTGTLLGTAVFSGESAAGWQQAAFASPVAVTADTTYVVSYHAPDGHYAVNPNGFATTGVDAPPLHALRSGVDGPNGVYRYGGAGGFPTGPSNSNYWVDLVFQPGG